MYRQRIKIFLAIIGLVFLSLAIKLCQLQILDGQDYRRQFDESLRVVELLPAIRGQILDRNGLVLATDRRCFDLCMDYRFITQDARWVRQHVRQIRLEQGISQQQAEDVYEQRAANSWTVARAVAAANQVDLDAQVDKIRRRVEHLREIVGGEVKEERIGHAVVPGLESSINLDQTVGASIEPSLKRFYPRDHTACHVVGYTAQVSAAEQQELNLPANSASWLKRMLTNYLDGDPIGKSGVEKMCEQALHGQRGYRKVKRGSGGEVESFEPATHGRDVELSIDAVLQEELAELLTRRGVQGSVVAISIPKGEVLAMVSVPTYDLNHVHSDLDVLGKNEVDLPLLNRAVARQYPIGSTAKVVTAMAGLGTGLTSGTTFTCEGMFFPGHPEKHFKCEGIHSTIDLVTAIQKSCNVYFNHVGLHVGPDRMESWLRLLGYGSKPGTGLPEEVPGNILPPGGAAAQPSDAMLWAIGQGTFAGTPLQVADAMAAAATGEFLSPTILLNDESQRARRAIPLERSQLAAIQRGMWEVVNESGGTGYKVFRDSAVSQERLDVVVCGKTGTADCPPQKVHGQVVRSGNMAWFAGYASYTNPQIAFAVVVEYVPGHGGAEAGPIARELVRLCKMHGYIH